VHTVTHIVDLIVHPQSTGMGGGCLLEETETTRDDMEERQQF